MQRRGAARQLGRTGTTLEMVRRDGNENAPDIEVYSCDLRSPSQRPTTKRTNGLLRRCLPKSTCPHIPHMRPTLTEDNPNETPRRQHHRPSTQTNCIALNCNHRYSLPTVRALTIERPHHLLTL